MMAVNMGVRGRLLLAFFGISMFSLVAAASALFSLGQVGGALSQITDERVPQAIAWLELSRLAERVTQAAPSLLVVTTEQSRREVSEEIFEQAEQLDRVLQRIKLQTGEDQELIGARMLPLVGNMNDNLLRLDELVRKRLSITTHKEKLIRNLARVNSIANRMMAPGVQILEAQIAEWNRDVAADDGNALNGEETELARSIISLTPQQKGGALIEAVNNTLLKIASVNEATEINVLIFPLKRAINELTIVAQGVPKRVRRRLLKQITLFESFAIGPNSLSNVRKDELAVLAEAEELLLINDRLSRVLTKEVDRLVGGANTDILNARSQALEVQRLSTNVLVTVALLSFIASVLIVWLYVGRNLIARLTALSDSMLAIAGGDLKSALPAASGSDEIARMAEALTVFRDTAVEVAESNLAEIEEARRRLVDAIENSSEGFAFYDPDDRLVICNSRYREMLYPNTEVEIKPGMSFEEIIRRSAHDGNIVDAVDRMEDWLSDRLATHRDPGEPILQRRADGRWMLISERKTSDGGTVAIYSDITDLKQREEELAEKSNAMEQLSNQLAKYLSPQIYDLIFSGQQEVKLVSQRKRLTVFFSDIANFTETTERLESEDLTQLLNHYLTEMSQIALKYGATVDKYVGDAIVIFFGDPKTRGVKEDALACVKMALEMRKRMVELQDVWTASGIENPLRCRIGISTGLCTVGNFGSEDRMDYTIIGGGVNLASRLEHACTPGEILISYETHAHVKEEIHCEEYGQVNVKGIGYPVATYKVVDLHKNLRADSRPIHARLPHMQLDVDVTQMTPEQQRDAAQALQNAAKQLEAVAAKT